MKLKLSSKLIIQILFFCTVVILASNLINGFFIRSKEAEKNQNVSKALTHLSSKNRRNKENSETQFFSGHYDRDPMNKKHLLLNKGTSSALKIAE